MEAFDQTTLALALSEACADLPFSVSADQKTTLLAYLAMMHKWNKTAEPLLPQSWFAVSDTARAGSHNRW